MMSASATWPAKSMLNCKLPRLRADLTTSYSPGSKIGSSLLFHAADVKCELSSQARAVKTSLAIRNGIGICY